MAQLLRRGCRWRGQVHAVAVGDGLQPQLVGQPPLAVGLVAVAASQPSLGRPLSRLQSHALREGGRRGGTPSAVRRDAISLPHQRHSLQGARSSAAGQAKQPCQPLPTMPSHRTWPRLSFVAKMSSRASTPAAPAGASCCCEPPAEAGTEPLGLQSSLLVPSSLARCAAATSTLDSDGPRASADLPAAAAAAAAAAAVGRPARALSRVNWSSISLHVRKSGWPAGRVPRQSNKDRID